MSGQRSGQAIPNPYSVTQVTRELADDREHGQKVVPCRPDATSVKRCGCNIEGEHELCCRLPDGHPPPCVEPCRSEAQGDDFLKQATDFMIDLQRRGRQVHASDIGPLASMLKRVHDDGIEIGLAMPDGDDEWADRPTPDDEAIQAVFPTRSNRHDLYREAQRLVGARHGKFALLAMVNWLLHRIEQAEQRSAAAKPATNHPVDCDDPSCLMNAALQGTPCPGQHTVAGLRAIMLQAFLSAVSLEHPCPFCLARTDNAWPYCTHFHVCPLKDQEDAICDMLDVEAVAAKSGGGT